MIRSAVITAGARVEGEFARLIGTSVKALAPVGGTTLLARTIAAARSAGAERIAVVGGAEVHDCCAREVERVIPENPDGVENLRLALHAWGDAQLLYLTSDIPFVTPAALREFVSRVPTQMLAMPLTEWDDFVRRYPGAPPFGATIGGARVVNGGAFVIPAGAAGAIEACAGRLFRARKSLWRMASLLGPAAFLRFALGRVRIGDLEARARRVVGIPAIAVRNAPAVLAYDVDTLEEYRYALENS